MKRYETCARVAVATAIFACGYAACKCGTLSKLSAFVRNLANKEKDCEATNHVHEYQIKLKRKSRPAERRSGSHTSAASNHVSNEASPLPPVEQSSDTARIVETCRRQYQKSKDSRSNSAANSDPFTYTFDYDEAASKACSFDIIHADAIEWMTAQEGLKSSVFTSMPDFSEMQLTPEKWRPWFVNAAKLILEKIPDGQYAIFYQTDVKRIGQEHGKGPTSGKVLDGGHHAAVMNEWIDKAHLIQTAADSVNGVKLLWHRIFLIADVGGRKIGRPTYSHMLCFGKGGAVVPDASRPALPDVLERGEMLSAKATGITACVFGALNLKLYGVKKVTDPFCGRASTLLACKLFQMDSVGVDLSKGVCNTAQSLGSTGFGAFAEIALGSSFIKPSRSQARLKLAADPEKSV